MESLLILCDRILVDSMPRLLEHFWITRPAMTMGRAWLNISNLKGLLAKNPCDNLPEKQRA